jgi:hypothetical protein
MARSVIASPRYFRYARSKASIQAGIRAREAKLSFTCTTVFPGKTPSDWLMEHYSLTVAGAAQVLDECLLTLCLPGKHSVNRPRSAPVSRLTRTQEKRSGTMNGVTIRESA